MQACLYLCACLACFIPVSQALAAGDTLSISLRDAEQGFLEKNLQLMAAKYDIEISRAEIIQARLFENPSVSAELDIFNPDNSKWFDATKETGQYMFTIEQLIRLGGKRNKAVALAQAEHRMTENGFFDLLRTLRYTLNSVFYETYYVLRSMEAFDVQIQLLQEQQQTHKELERNGVVSLSEVVRIRSLLYNLQADKLELQQRFNELQSQLQLLLQNNKTIFIPVIDKEEFAFSDPSGMLLPGLIEDARLNRIDLQLAHNEIAVRQRNLSLEKSMAIPDLTLGANYDKRSNFTDHVFCFNVTFDLPFFNRNQGKIKAAKVAVLQGELLLKQKELEVENEIATSYKNALEAHEVSRIIEPQFEVELQELLQSITTNFRKKNISFLEFTDFYESYRENILKINQIRNQTVQAMETLRFVTAIK